MKYTLEIELSEQAVDLLRKIDNNGYAEYRDPVFRNIDELRKYKSRRSDIDGLTEADYLIRNFGGTLYLTGELYLYGLIESDDDCFHLTFYMTELGKVFLKQNNL
jgi:hypothetical protein